MVRRRRSAPGFSSSGAVAPVGRRSHLRRSAGRPCDGPAGAPTDTPAIRSRWRSSPPRAASAGPAGCGARPGRSVLGRATESAQSAQASVSELCNAAASGGAGWLAASPPRSSGHSRLRSAPARAARRSGSGGRASRRCRDWARHREACSAVGRACPDFPAPPQAWAPACETWAPPQVRAADPAIIAHSCQRGALAVAESSQS